MSGICSSNSNSLVEGFIAILIIGIPILAIVFGVGSVFYDIGKFAYDKVVDAIAIMKPLHPKRKAILNKYFFYYRQLSRQDQKKFEERVNRFLYSKNFIGRSIEVTDEMKVLISATAILLTFGLPMITLAHFDKILMYPDEYYSRINRSYHLGEVNPRLGIIILSWRHFVEGFVDNQDGRNLAFHEMAHAVHFENQIRNEEYDFLDSDMLSHWDKLAAQEIENIRSNADHFLRDYAGTNQHEFFAVAVEYFFESGELFREQLPRLYKTMVLLLNQDPVKLFKL